MGKRTQKQLFHILLLLILAGEAVFILPFVLARIFRPTFLDVFSIDNFELGTCFSIYGIVAFISYFFGGGLADRVQPRYLLATSLFLTALGGIYMMSFPSYTMLKMLFGYWGFTTIFLFWAAMIKATRVWGGKERQGLAFGFLDGGRGLVAASMGAIGLVIFSNKLTLNTTGANPALQQEAFAHVLLASSIFVACIGFCILLWLKPISAEEDQTSERSYLRDYLEAMKNPVVWMLMVIVCCAYVGYKVTDIFSLYARDVMGFDEIESAGIGTMLMYLRPLVGIALGLLINRSKPIRWIIIGFSVVGLGAGIIASGVLSPNTYFLFFISVIITAIGVYALRTLYFAVMEEGRIPVMLTGTVVGLVSLIGYTPDIFATPLIGMLLENSPGETGHQHVFWMLLIFAAIGLVIAILFQRKTTSLSRQ